MALIIYYFNEAYILRNRLKPNSTSDYRFWYRQTAKYKLSCKPYSTRCKVIAGKVKYKFACSARLSPYICSLVTEWLTKEQIQQLSLVISNVSTQEVLERWDFKIEYEVKKSDVNGEEVTGNKDIKVIQKEIKDVLRQICASVSFLPLLDCPCSFDLHIYATPETDVPDEWGERGPCFIANSEELQFKSFSTSVHRMKTVVSYKAD